MLSTTDEVALCGFRLERVPVNVDRARLLARHAHRGQTQASGEPLVDHIARVVAATPEFARPVAWLHEVLEWTSVSEEELLTEGATDDELRAVRLLTRTVGRGSGSGYLAHVAMIARAGGMAGRLARTVKTADLEDRLCHSAPGTPGARPPYEQALKMVVAASAAQSLPVPEPAESPAA